MPPQKKITTTPTRIPPTAAGCIGALDDLSTGRRGAATRHDDLKTICRSAYQRERSLPRD